MSDGEYETADAGASGKTPIACGAIKKNSYVIIKDRPCKITEVSASKTGKHGSAKVHYVGVDIFTGKKIEECCPSSQTAYAPTVTKTEYVLCNIEDDGYLALLDQNNDTRSDIKAGDQEDEMRELFDSLKDNEDVLVTIISSMGQAMVYSFNKK